MAGCDQMERVSLTVSDAPPRGASEGLLVRRALLPLAVWDGVAVLARSARALTMMERFVVECLLRLGKMRPEELQEVASISTELADWLLGSLKEKGCARQLDDGWYAPEHAACARVLAENSVAVERQELRSLLWFPDTGEMVALADAGALPRQLRKTEPAARYPLPHGYHGKTRAQIARDAMADGRLLGREAAAIADVMDGTQFDQDTCPAYECSAVLPTTGENGWHLELAGRLKRDKALSNTSTADHPADPVRLPVPFMPGLRERWVRRLIQAAGSIGAELERRFGLGEVRVADDGITASAGLEAVRSLGRKRLVADSLGLTVRLDDEIEYSLPLHVEPADDAARYALRVDAALRTLLGTTDVNGAVASVCQEAGVPVDGVLDRAWELKNFRMVYDLREAEDFAV